MKNSKVKPTKQNKSNIIAIIQARMSSSRLPGKILKEITGEPMLARVVSRVIKADMLSKVVVATTTGKEDDATETLCRERQFDFFRGSEFDVLDRYYQTARVYGADVVVRITADCPLIDPSLINSTINAFLGIKESGFDYLNLSPDLEKPTGDLRYPYDFTANRLPPPWGRTTPIGMDVEVCSFRALEEAWNEADKDYHREHVMPYFYESCHPDSESPPKFRSQLVNLLTDLGNYRWTVDTPEDLEFVREIYRHLGENDEFSWQDVLGLVKQYPGLLKINQQIKHKTLFETDRRN